VSWGQPRAERQKLPIVGAGAPRRSLARIGHINRRVAPRCWQRFDSVVVSERIADPALSQAKPSGFVGRIPVMNPTTANPSARLSNLQGGILRGLVAHEQRAAQSGENDPAPRPVPVKDLRGPGPKSAADSAAFSRALRRLAQRRLIILCNVRHGVRSGPNAFKVNIDPADKHARADHLILTPLGRAIAGTISTQAEETVNSPCPTPALDAVRLSGRVEAASGSTSGSATAPVSASVSARASGFAPEPKGTPAGPADLQKRTPEPPAPSNPMSYNCVMCHTPYPGRPDCGICRRNHLGPTAVVRQ
jgi:hypothetical protein